MITPSTTLNATPPAIIKGNIGTTDRDSAILSMNQRATLLNNLNNPSSSGGFLKRKTRKTRKTRTGKTRKTRKTRTGKTRTRKTKTRKTRGGTASSSSSPSPIVVSSPNISYNDISAGNQSVSSQYSTIASNTNQANANAQYDKLAPVAPPIPSSYYNASGGKRKRKRKRKITRRNRK